MKDHNVMVSQVHQRNDIFSCLKEYQINLPVLDHLEKELVCIPVGWWVSDEQLKYIVSCITNFFTE